MSELETSTPSDVVVDVDHFSDEPAALVHAPSNLLPVLYSRADYSDAQMASTGPRPETLLAVAGRAADRAAAASAFDDYRSRRTASTTRRQRADLAAFASFLADAGVPVGNLEHDAEAWRGLTRGLVEAFALWQLRAGYAIGTINVRLSTVRTYAQLAARAGAVDAVEALRIAGVRAYGHREGRNLDAGREKTRTGTKKAEWTSISPAQAVLLKDQPDTPQGRRDRVLITFLLDHGLRCGELAELRAGDVDLEEGTLRFYRRKVDKTQTHRLTADTLRALLRHLGREGKGAPTAPLLRSSVKGGRLDKAGMSTRAVTERVRELGRRLGIAALSAHDCRHFWATDAARNGTPIDRLQDAGGWSSPFMPLRYVEGAKVANAGVRLSGG